MSGISYFLPRLIGAARAFEILLTGRPVDAEEAERIGLCARLVEDDMVVDEALAFARIVLANSPSAVSQTKRMMWDNLDVASFDAAIALENRTQILASLTDDYKEATAAFTTNERRASRGNSREDASRIQSRQGYSRGRLAVGSKLDGECSERFAHGRADPWRGGNCGAVSMVHQFRRLQTADRAL